MTGLERKIMPKALNEFEKREKLLALREQRSAKRALEGNPTAAANAEKAAEQAKLNPDAPQAVRRRRGAFNGTTPKLSVTGDIPGYHMRIFSDSENRIELALDDGYEFVRPSEITGVSENVVSRNGDLGDRIRFLVNPRASGPMQYGYLMKIRQEWWEEDQADLQMQNNRIDSAIKKGRAVVTDNIEDFYVPKGGISIKRT